MMKRVPGAGYALTLAVGLSAMIALSAVLVPRPSSTLVFPVDTAGFSPASRPQSYQPMGASITPITSVAAGSSGISFSGDAYDVSCTVSAAAGTLYPAMHDGTNWTVYYAYPCALDGTVATKATCIFPARRGSGLTWNAFRTGAATINACTAEQRYTGGGLSAVPPPPASTAAAFDPASPGAIGGTTPAAGTFTSLSGAAGTGALSWGSMTGNTTLPTGGISWTGALNKSVSIVGSGSGTVAITAGSSLDITGGSSSSVTTTAGQLSVDSAAALALGTNTATSVSVGSASVGTTVNGNLTVATGKQFSAGSNNLLLSDQLAASKLLIASQAAGDVLYASSSTAWSRLGVGSNGQVLTLASGVPSWASAPFNASFSGSNTNTGAFGAATTAYLPGPGDAGAGLTNAQRILYIVTRSGTLGKLNASIKTAPAGADTVILTVQKSTDRGASWSDTSLTCTITGASTNCQDNIDAPSTTALDWLAIKLVSSANTAAGPIAVGAEVY